MAERREAERETAAFSAALTQRQADLLRLLGEETEGLAERAEAEIDKKLAAALKRSDALRARYAENMRERLASSALAAAVAHLPRGFNASGVSTLAQATEPDLVPETRAKRRHER